MTASDAQPGQGETAPRAQHSGRSAPYTSWAHLGVYTRVRCRRDNRQSFLAAAAGCQVDRFWSAYTVNGVWSQPPRSEWDGEG